MANTPGILSTNKQKKSNSKQPLSTPTKHGIYRFWGCFIMLYVTAGQTMGKKDFYFFKWFEKEEKEHFMIHKNYVKFKF